MTSSRPFDPTLYAIVGSSATSARSAPALVARAISGGVTAVQIRPKNLRGRRLVEFARAILEVTRRLGVPCIVNDRADLALRMRAEGVHLGAADMPVAGARRLLGESAIVGATAHSLDEIRAAEAAGADYIGFGSTYPSPTKKVEAIQGVEGIAEARKVTDLPLVAIGGITVARAEAVIRAGADGVAVISGLWSAGDVEARAREYVRAIERGRGGR